MKNTGLFCVIRINKIDTAPNCSLEQVFVDGRRFTNDHISYDSRFYYHLFRAFFGFATLIFKMLRLQLDFGADVIQNRNLSIMS